MTLQETIAELRAAVENLERASQLDDKTPLLNSLALRARLSDLPAKCEDAIVVFGDLNGFKEVNDTYSHAAGDAAIDRIGVRLNEVLNPFEATAFRQSGDKFVIVVEEPNPDSVFKELKRSFSEVFVKHRKEDQAQERFSVRMSFGWTRVDQNSPPETWLERAEVACRCAKKIGDGEVVEWTVDLESDELSFRRRCRNCGCSSTIQPSIKLTQEQLVCPQCKHHFHLKSDT